MSEIEKPIYINCDNTIEIDGLRNSRLASSSLATSYINSGTVTMTLYDADNVAVTGATALALAYVTSSDGDWYGTIPYSVALTENAKYTLVITATDGTYRVVVYQKLRAEYYYGE